ncbi:hypothetical protein BC830DRAFT_259814 [Chytriomyces sp. MP71]|nr:hypothetical protein BC830DRAFT_259814 [Chytriomyces sp. MP71]
MANGWKVLEWFWSWFNLNLEHCLHTLHLSLCLLYILTTHLVISPQGFVNLLHLIVLLLTRSMQVVKKEIVSSYTSDVMVPLALRLFDVVKKLSKSKENYNDLNNRMKHVFGNIANGGFISKENAAHISWTMKDLYSESYMSLPENLASSLFEILTTIMAKCACEMANTSFNAPIPEAWINISSCSQTLAKILLSPISDPQARMTAKSKLAKLNLKTLLIFNSEIKSKAIRHAQMMPVEATWAIPGAKMYFSDLHFDRQLAIFKNEVDLVHHHSQLLQERKDNLLHIAESLISTLVANGFKVSSYGYLELSKAEFKSRLNILFMETNKLSVFNEFIIEIYDSNTWLSDLEGFENFKNDFRLLLLESPQLEMNSPARLASLINAVFVDELASSRMQDDLAQCCLKLLRDFHNSFSALQRWNELGPNSSRSPIAPKHDDNGLNCILSLLSKLEETLEPSNQESSIFKFLQSVFTGCPSFLLLKSPASITHFILHHNCSKLEDAWISYLSSALAIKDTAILEHPISGTQGVASILQKIFIKAKSKQFEVKEPETARFTSIFCCHLRLVLYLCPSAVEYLSDFPTSPCGKKLVEEILQQYGPVTACSFLEAVFEGKVTEVDIGSFMSNDVPSFTHSVPFFNLIADKKGEDVLLITSQNSHRKNLGSVQGVMDEFQKVKKHPALDKYLHRKAISSASAIVDIHTPPASNDVVFFVLSRFKLEMALTNPILYLRVATSALQIAKIQPFQYPTLNLLDITVLANSIKDKKDSFNATPLQYLIDLARLLSESIAPQFDAVKSFRIASTVRRIALETLKSVHSVTVECCFAKGSKTMASVVDLLVFEAAVNGKLAGEMLIPGFWEAIQNLMFSGDRKVFDGCLELQSSSWQLKWAEHELKEKKVDK